MQPQYVIAGLAAALLLGAGIRALTLAAWRTLTVQDWVLRWTGESRYVPTSHLQVRPIMHGAPRRPLVGCQHRPGRTVLGEPARASAPATTSLPGEIAAGSTARPDASSSEAPRVGAGTQTPDVVDCLITSGLPAAVSPTPWTLGHGGPKLTAAAGEDPERPAAAVLQLGGAAC
jgi:hypothetical protein